MAAALVFCGGTQPPLPKAYRETQRGVPFFLPKSRSCRKNEMPIFCAKANNLKKSKKAKLQNCLNAHYLQNYQKFFVSFPKPPNIMKASKRNWADCLKTFVMGG
jgi:hypothetical protein